MTAYELIKECYGDITTKRSGVRYMNHIDEGLQILEGLGSSDIAKGAYCLHPLLQADDDFKENWSGLFPPNLIDVAVLATEYRNVANSYLSNHKGDIWVNIVNNEIRHMLIADKVQNYKDFLIYHKGVHERSDELDIYFNKWFSILGIDYHEVVKFIK